MAGFTENGGGLVGKSKNLSTAASLTHMRGDKLYFSEFKQ